MTDAGEYRRRDDAGQANSFQGNDNMAAQYAARGWKPIPIPRGEKGPKSKDWDKRTYNPDRDFDGSNVGVQLGLVSCGLTDVDLDCAEAIALAPDFLPPTGAVFGRKSKPRSHWLYTIDDPDPDKSAIRLIDDAKKAIIELRMGGGGKGAQTVFPGSVHESGEKVEWAQAGERHFERCHHQNRCSNVTSTALACQQPSRCLYALWRIFRACGLGAGCNWGVYGCGAAGR